MTDSPPSGSVCSTITYLQMFHRPAPLAPAPPRESLLVLRARRPSTAFYRFLYDAVGKPWQWVDRRRMSDEELRPLIQDELVEVHVLYVEGAPAGYFELDLRSLPDIELVYFGLVPEFTGQRLGPWLLDRAIERAWDRGPRRLWLHTCTEDHPAALPLYRKAGFEPYRTEHKLLTSRS